MWLSDVEVEETASQEPYSVSLLAFCWYSQPLRAPLPVTEVARVSSALPVRVTVGVVGVPGLVRKAEAAASSVAQALSM